MRIGVDVMGGDFAPEKTVQGVVLALDFLTDKDKILLFGKKQLILHELSKYNNLKKNLEIIDCPDVIHMGEHPMQTLKTKKESSIHKGFDFLKNDNIDGFAGAGNTGAMFVGGYYSIKPIKGILRPSIAALIPTLGNKNSIILDVGVNADCKADVLYQFGVLGQLFSKYVSDINEPKVSLLNLGEEKTKGNMLTQATYQLMQDSKDYNFIGNIESRDLFDGKADVIVCDGFTGNIVIKQIEGFYKLIKKKKIKNNFFNLFNYENYGGTPVLGFNKPVIIGHGISNEIAIKNMILMTKNIIQSNLCQKIKNYLK